MKITTGNNLPEESIIPMLEKYCNKPGLYLSNFHRGEVICEVSFQSLYENNEKIYTIQVNCENEPIGMLIASLDIENASNDVKIDAVWTKDSHRRLGIGMEMYKAIRSHLNEEKTIISSFSLGTFSLMLWYKLLINETGVLLKWWNSESGKTEYVNRKNITKDETSQMLLINNMRIDSIEDLFVFEWHIQ